MNHAASSLPHAPDPHPKPRERAVGAVSRPRHAGVDADRAFLHTARRRIRFAPRRDRAVAASGVRASAARRARRGRRRTGPLTPAQRESGAAGYRRHLLAADPAGRYAVVSLVWEPGQWSPVHGHHAWCGYAVLEGKLTEIVYRWSDAACCAIDARRRARPMGAVSYVCAGRDAIHRLGHAGAKTDAPAISLHVYGVAGEQVATHVNDVVAVDARAYA